MALIETIAPYQVSAPATTLEIQSIRINFNAPIGYAEAICAFKNDAGETQKLVTVEFTAEELSAWGDDDQILAELVKAKLGIQ